MTNGAPRTIHGYLVCHENGMPAQAPARSEEGQGTGNQVVGNVLVHHTPIACRIFTFATLNTCSKGCA